jgi:trehalose 6-phosphate phosphatase
MSVPDRSHELKKAARKRPRMTDVVTSRAPAPLAGPSALRYAVFLDFDGTLVDIAARPEWVCVDPALLKVLDQLKRRLDGALAIVSGRSLAVLDRLLAPLRFDASGLHGAECRRGEETWCGTTVPAPFRHAVDELKREFDREAGLLVEDKGKAVSLHWREAPHRAGDALAALARVAHRLGDDYRVQHGKAVAELVPAGASKGTAIAQFLTAPPYEGRCPVFIGDDLTDEQGFEVVNAKGGLSAHVGAGPTRAQFRLGSPAEVRSALQRWAEGEPIGFSSTPSTVPSG